MAKKTNTDTIIWPAAWDEGTHVSGASEDDVVYTAADVDTYLSGFDGVSAEVKRRLKKKPRLLNLIKKEFSHDEQVKIVGNPFLIALLSIFGPMILEFIKNWLTKN